MGKNSLEFSSIEKNHVTNLFSTILELFLRDKVDFLIQIKIFSVFSVVKNEFLVIPNCLSLNRYVFLPNILCNSFA
jgi:hypothetical protein